MKRLHIAIVIPGFPTERDEPGLAAVVDLVERVGADCDVNVIALRHPAHRVRYEMVGAQVQGLGLGRAGGALGRARVMTAGLAALLKAHRRQGIDVIHGLWADEAGAIAALAGRLIRRPTVVSVMGGELVALPDIGYGAALGRGGRWTTATALRLGSAVTCGSSYLRQQALSQHPDTRVVMAPLGVDTEMFRPAAMPPAGQTVLFVGSLEPVKNPLLMLRAFAAAAPGRPELKLVLAGDGRLRSALEHEANQLGIAQQTRFLGQLPRSQMPDLYRSASVLCITSRHEAQSMAAVEAAAVGLPVMGPGVGVLPDLGGGALVVQEANAANLARALGTILDDPVRARHKGTAARESCLRLYDIEVTTQAFLRLYADLVSRRWQPDRNH